MHATKCLGNRMIYPYDCVENFCVYKTRAIVISKKAGIRVANRILPVICTKKLSSG